MRWPMQLYSTWRNMVDGSGLRTTQADSSRGLSSTALRIIVLSVAVMVAAGCVYFNQLYNANRLYSQGVSDMEAGRAGGGQALLTEAIQKADKVAREHPNSRWADDALRLVRFDGETTPGLLVRCRLDPR